MPTINPNLVPTIVPGSLFEALTNVDTLNIRWLTGRDPCFFGVLNRPMTDIALRQLIIAKTLDQLNGSLGHTALFPYLIQPQVSSGSGAVDVPINWVWDINLSLPSKWTNVRLAKIKRISGENGSAGGTSGHYTGALRLIFTGVQTGSNIETAVLECDYQITSLLTYQMVIATAIPPSEEAVSISPSESETVTGFVTFQTLDTTTAAVQSFLQVLAPPVDGVVGSDGIYDSPSIYELVDSVPNSPSGDFSATGVSHGSGMLAVGAYNPLPALDSDILSWINAFNYPFDADANLTSTAGIVIPFGLFREFDITVPAGDQPTGDTSGTFFPVWVTRIERVDDAGDQIRFFFGTYNVTDSAPSTQPVEFATLDLTSGMVPGQIVDIVPATNLELNESVGAAQWGQHFGRGHVVLSALWGQTSSVIPEFFNKFALLTDNPPDTDFTQTGTRISSFGLSRVSKYTPTIGQSRALAGSSGAGRLTVPVDPSDTNRYVNEADQGLGNTINLEQQPGIIPNPAINAVAYSGALCHRIIKMVVNSTLITGDTTSFYLTQVLPRLTILYGRPPQFGDLWHNGTRVMFFNGDAFQSLG